ncbi:FtsK/SpoIIIE domain-containing protein [Leuconostoc falkenbergense]|uniref:FtsK/SpoIIIE domain-containing protein n=1 Tax=Leuconostoc falkenbergense TaxID=2766470 RepID=UPI0024ACE24D|nr:FtsK/SpoIIIE domain-containing protein [Leuconostoc falkenbergense]MDI6668147.1 FtsK/SpoIIIE domain-containing protein [Leuconostoc falkenbergense]
MINLEQKVKNTNADIRVFFISLFILNLSISIFVFDYFCHLSYILVFIDVLILLVYLVRLAFIGLLFQTNFKMGINLIVSYYRIESQLIDACIFYQRSSKTNDNQKLIVRVPRYFFKLEHNQIYLFIENSIKFTVQFDNLDISPALSGLVVDSKYKSSDSLFMVFQLSEANFKQLKFDNLDDFLHFAVKKRNEFKIDDKNFLKGHILITGKTGSGKTFGMLNLYLQMLVQKINVSVIDPKNSDLSAISEISGIKCATNADLALEMIKTYRNSMNDRKIEMNQLLKVHLASDFSDFKMSANYLIIDEFAALQMMLSKEQKAEFNIILAEIILQGRQLGYFVLFGMQQANASLLSTNIREQFNSIIVLGNSGKQTYITSFSNDNIPVRKIKQGAGWLKKDTEESVKYIVFPALNFNIGEAFKSISEWSANA